MIAVLGCVAKVASGFTFVSSRAAHWCCSLHMLGWLDSLGLLDSVAVLTGELLMRTLVRGDVEPHADDSCDGGQLAHHASGGLSSPFSSGCFSSGDDEDCSKVCYTLRMAGFRESVEC